MLAVWNSQTTKLIIFIHNPVIQSFINDKSSVVCRQISPGNLGPAVNFVIVTVVTFS